MEFCNKGMVWADPPPPVMVKDHTFTFFLWTLPLPTFIGLTVVSKSCLKVV